MILFNGVNPIYVDHLNQGNPNLNPLLIISDGTLIAKIPKITIAEVNKISDLIQATIIINH